MQLARWPIDREDEEQHRQEEQEEAVATIGSPRSGSAVGPVIGPLHRSWLAADWWVYNAV